MPIATTATANRRGEMDNQQAAMREAFPHEAWAKHAKNRFYADTVAKEQHRREFAAGYQAATARYEDALSELCETIRKMGTGGNDTALYFDALTTITSLIGEKK